MWRYSLSVLKKSFKEQVLDFRATAVPRLRSGRGAGAGPAGEAQDAHGSQWASSGKAGLAAPGAQARTLRIEGECRRRGQPAARGRGSVTPCSGSISSSALLQA